MTNSRNKYSLKNALIIILGVLSIFLTTLFAPIFTKKVHQQIVANAEESSTIKIKFKDTFTFPSKSDTYDVSFTSNGKQYTSFQIQLYTSPIVISYVWYNGSQNDVAYLKDRTDDKWNNSVYQIIEIDPNQDNFNAFITAMKSNIEGVELESGTYVWVDVPTPFKFNLSTAINFVSNNIELARITIDIDFYNIVYTSSNKEKYIAYSVNNDGWSNNAYKTIATSENQYIDYDFYNYAILGNQLVKQSTSSGEMWVLNETLQNNSLVYGKNLDWAVSADEYSIYQSLEFTSNNTKYYGLCNYDDTRPPIMTAQSLTVYHSGWTNESYRTVTFATSPTGDLLTWLQKNGTKQGPTPTAYSVTYALLNNCTADSTNPTSVVSNTTYQFKFNITDTSYDVTFVNVGNATLVSYTTSNGVITATINNVVGNVSIEVSVATSNTFNVVYTFNDGVIGNDDLPNTISSGQTISGSVVTQSGYRFSSITCSNGDFTFDYNSTQTKVDFTLKDVTSNTEIVFNAIIPQGTIIADSYKSSLTSAVIPSNNNIGYKLNTLYTINSNFVLYDGFNSINCTSFNMLFREVSNDVIVGAYFNDGSKNYNLFDTSYNWSNVYLKYVTLNDNVNTSLVAQKGFNYIYNTIYTDKTLSSGIYTFKLDNDYYSSSLRVDMPFVYWQNTSFTDVSQIRLLINNGLYYYSSLGSETIVYGADYYVNNNARCFKLLQSVSLNPYVYDTLTNMIESGNNIGIYIGGSYTFTFDNLNNLDTSSFTNFNFQYFKDNYYSQNISVKGFKVVNSQLFYILYDNTEVLVYNGAWVEDYYRYISIIYQNVSDEQYTYLNNVGVFKNLYVGENVTTWRQFFFTIADVPLYIFSRIFYFELFGEQTFIIIYSILTILIVFKIVSWALKLKD